MTIIDLYFKHFPGAGWGKLHSFLSEWDILQIYVPYPDAEVQFKIDGARKVRMELAKNWILRNSEILNKKEEMERQAMNVKFKWVIPDEGPSDAILFTEIVLGDKNVITRFSGNDTIYDIDKFVRQFEKRARPTFGFKNKNFYDEAALEDTPKSQNREICDKVKSGAEVHYLSKACVRNEDPCRNFPTTPEEAFDWAAFNKELNRKAREYSGTFEDSGELDEKTVKQDLTPEGVLKKMAGQPLEFRKQPDMYEVVSDGPVEDTLPGMYELVSESYYMLQELTEKKRQEEEIDTETFEMHKKAAIDAMTQEEMIAQVNVTNRAIDDLKRQRPDFPIELISDGYHTFKELYEFRMLYNAALFNEWAKATGAHYGAVNPFKVHKSWRHHDGESCFGGGWFIVSAMLPTGLISNHYESKYWDYFKIPGTEKARFEFDGHTSNDVLNRLSAFLVSK